ncbi:MAG: hypothetical protein RMJ65_04760, partial [candidate division WOR-3 bacterium]|nr:hypothetical protein [candidate division WOR-3 bacterium]
ALSNKFVDEGQVNSISSPMIIDGTITNADISATAGITDTKLSGTGSLITNLNADLLDGNHASAFAPVYHTHNYVDSCRISITSYDARKLQGKDTLDLDARYVNEGQVAAISSAMILDGTIQRQDVSPNFKAPYADTADYVRNVYLSYVDSARIATNAHRLQGKDTVALSNKFVDEGQVNSISSPMIIDGTITNAKLSANSVTTDKIQDGTIQIADLAFLPATRPLVPEIDSTEIKNNAVTTSKIKDGTILGHDLNIPLSLTGNVSWPGGIVQIKNSGVGSGIKIDTAGFGGLRIDYTFGDGINIGYAAQTGLAIDTVGGTAIRIINPSFDGIGIDNAGFAGLYAMHANDNGIQIDSAENYGIYAQGNVAGASFLASNPGAYGLEVYSYGADVDDTALVAYGAGYATGGWYTSGLVGNKSAPCVISPDLAIIASGSGIISGNKVDVTLAPEFVENIREDIPIRIVLTPKSKVGGILYVSETKVNGFTVEIEEIPGLKRTAEPVRFDWIAFGTLKTPNADYSSKWQKLIKDRQTKKIIRTRR